MKKWKKLCIILLLTTIFHCSCGQPEEVVKEQELPKTTPVVLTSMKEEVKEETKGLVEQLEPKTIEGISNYNAVNRKLSRDPAKNGVSLFCLDEITGVVYFVNQNQDHYLYRIKDGEVKLAVALPVKDIYTWDGAVYFMIESYEKYELKEKKEGDIYRYIPTTGEIELVYELSAVESSQYKMTVNENGVHFNYSEEMPKKDGFRRVKIYYYSLLFGTTEPIKDITYQGDAGWKNYYFSYDSLTDDYSKPAQLILVSRTDGLNDIIPIEIGQLEYCVVDNTIYSIGVGETNLLLLDLENQESHSYDFREMIIQVRKYTEEEIVNAFGENHEILSSFTMTEQGKILWVTDSKYLYRLDVQSGEITYFATMDKSRSITELYTDGEQVYALYSPKVLGTPSLVRFCMEEIGLNEKGETAVAVEYLVPQEEVSEE